MISAGLAACGGGGGGTSSTGAVAPVGPASVEISIAAAPATGSSAVPVTVAGPSTVPTPDPLFKWADEILEPSPQIAHVYMDVLKVSLMPAEEAFGGEDMDGEIRDDNGQDPPSPPDKPHFITLVPDHAIRIDLLKLENGKRLARFLNRFDLIPAGTYDKIRVYYDNVVVVLNDPDKTRIRFHPTAHSKFDIHFRQGHELVIASASDTTQQDGWVKFFRVQLDVVGLKIRVVSQGKSWKGSKAILRPQIFAKFVPPVLYSVAGTATIKSKTPTAPVSGTFDISFGPGPRVIPAAFDNDTTWAYSDNVLGHSKWIVDVANTTAVPAFRDRATVMAIGPFDPSLELQATDIVFSFPDVRQGTSDNVWILDNTAFIVRSDVDNVVVIPKPARDSAYYDNAVTDPIDNTHHPLDFTAIDNDVSVKARGYFEDPGAPDLALESYWISIGP
ncbi:MAG TPA: DUF4382 domain-containing protein [Candidatus Deferrimicrobiaceae bacterium]